MIEAKYRSGESGETQLLKEAELLSYNQRSVVKGVNHNQGNSYESARKKCKTDGAHGIISSRDVEVSPFSTLSGSFVNVVEL